MLQNITTANQIRSLYFGPIEQFQQGNSYCYPHTSSSQVPRLVSWHSIYHSSNFWQTVVLSQTTVIRASQQGSRLGSPIPYHSYYLLPLLHPAEDPYKLDIGLPPNWIHLHSTGNYKELFLPFSRHLLQLLNWPIISLTDIYLSTN